MLHYWSDAHWRGRVLPRLEVCSICSRDLPTKPDCGNGPAEKKSRVGGEGRYDRLSQSGLRWRPAAKARGSRGSGRMG